MDCPLCNLGHKATEYIMIPIREDQFSPAKGHLRVTKTTAIKYGLQDKKFITPSELKKLSLDLNK